MQEGNEMAFQFAGDRGQHLMAALDAADQQKAKFRALAQCLTQRWDRQAGLL
jgi:uncharacterized protein (DUF1778 family)